MGKCKRELGVRVGMGGLVLQDGAVNKDSQTAPSPNPTPDEATLMGFRFQGLAGCLTTTDRSAGGWEQLQFRQILPFPLPWEGWA